MEENTYFMYSEFRDPSVELRLIRLLPRNQTGLDWVQCEIPLRGRTAEFFRPNSGFFRPSRGTAGESAWRREAGYPVAGDVLAAAHPDMAVGADVVDKADQRFRPAGVAG